MRIGEVARRSGLSPSRIRFYEEHGLLPRAARSDNGYRDYPGSTVETLGLIDQAQRLGFTLGEIKSSLAEAGGVLPPKSHMLPALRARLSSLEQYIDEAMRRRDRVVELIAKFERAC